MLRRTQPSNKWQEYNLEAASRNGDDPKYRVEIFPIAGAAVTCKALCRYGNAFRPNCELNTVMKKLRPPIISCYGVEAKCKNATLVRLEKLLGAII